ncbi:DUF4167 domain-containing protein [Parasphingorhabdus flavimaris]|jgi:hypothetical protein|uniref:DUF4167 domain-containing protein n=2 Tax=Parasphingorhabdus flavimaris TaxID=266812 RepID=A0ABX2N5S1_9SPHN|nr:DUF4167 domain-containing protein [Parasphingorhabdus flavimaris]NVD29065.1 DUF4167 domain-containing protein [Parasphingorhabdus flavimaris]|tara:strand:- start:11245 stop:11916 length:672 start_codon:yes stop_codon:yes gene_type:complete
MNNRQPGRRGRGRNTNNNNRPQGNRSGGSDRDNRIDSRARGNAAQMLEKFKKMAQDAQVNGDRVQAEYYHQFADHYFRVNADTIARREEQRIAREESRPDNRNNNNNQDDSGDNDGDNSRGRPQQSQQNRPQRDDRNDHADRDDAVTSEAAEEKKPVRSRRPRKVENVAARSDATEKNGESNGLDASALPPAISRSAEVEVEKKPARKKRVPKPQPVQEGDIA